MTAWTWRAERSVQDLISLVCFPNALALGSQRARLNGYEHPTDIQFQILVSWGTQLDFMCFHAIVQDFLCLCASLQKFKLYILIPHKMRRLKFSARSEDGSTEGSKRGRGCSCPQEREVSYINYEKTLVVVY